MELRKYRNYRFKNKNMKVMALNVYIHVKV